MDLLAWLILRNFEAFHAVSCWLLNKINNHLSYWDTFIALWSNCHKSTITSAYLDDKTNICFCNEEILMMTGNFGAISRRFHQQQWQLSHKLSDRIITGLLPFFIGVFLLQTLLTSINRLSLYATKSHPKSKSRFS